MTKLEKLSHKISQNDCPLPGTPNRPLDLTKIPGRGGKTFSDFKEVKKVFLAVVHTAWGFDHGLIYFVFAFSNRVFTSWREIFSVERQQVLKKIEQNSH